MFFKTLNKIKCGFHHNFKFVKIELAKNEFIIINLMIKLGIIKKVIKIKNNTYVVYFNYIKNKKIFNNIINLYKPSKKIFLKLTTLKKLTLNKNWILILSTNRGVLTNVEAVKYNIGGLVIAKIWN